MFGKKVSGEIFQRLKQGEELLTTTFVAGMKWKMTMFVPVGIKFTVTNRDTGETIKARMVFSWHQTKKIKMVEGSYTK